MAEKAVAVNDNRKVYEALANIYFESKRFGYAVDVYKLLAKKYFDDPTVWSQYTDAMFRIDQIRADAKHEDHDKVKELEAATKPRDILSRALQALDKKKHVDMIVKYGQQEYKYGNVENGRTMFEGVVSSFPKRTDAWGVYIDMEVKYGKSNKEYVRNLFERCIKLKLKEKKMQFFFKKYLDYELANGTSSTVEVVKQKAKDYVESQQFPTAPKPASS